MTQINLRNRIKSRQSASQNSPPKGAESSPQTSAPTGPLGTFIPPPPSLDFEELKEAPKKKSLIPADVNKKMLIFAAIIATIASFLAINYINSTYDKNASLTRPIKVVIAAREIPARTTITPEMLRTMEIPAMYVVGGALKPTDNIVGKIATTTIFANEQLHRLRVSVANAATGLSPNVPAGHRAMIIRTNMVNLIKPTDYVDIMVSLQDSHSQEKTITTSVLQRSLVLAVGAQINPNDPDSYRNYDQSITIAVPENRVNLMTLLEAKGNFKVALRSPGDESLIAETFTAKELESALGGQFVNPIPSIKPVEVKENNTSTSNYTPSYNYVAPTYNRPAPVYHAPVYRKPAPPPKQAPKVPMIYNLQTKPKK